MQAKVIYIVQNGKTSVKTLKQFELGFAKPK